MSINKGILGENAIQKLKEKFLISNIFFRNGPMFLGNELHLKIYQSYIDAKLQVDWIIFAFVIVRRGKRQFYQKLLFCTIQMKIIS